MSTRRRRIRSFRRTITVGVVGALVVLVVLPAASRAQEEPFNVGRASASGQVLRVAPGVGALELGMNFDVALADFQNSIARAQARGFDPGIIGIVLTAEGCDGGEAAFTSDDFPPAVTATSRDDDAGEWKRDDEAPVAGTAFGGNRKEARATGAPASHAIATGAAMQVDPLIDFGGGRAESQTQVVDGETREAVARTSASLTLLGGAIRLDDMQWHAVHRTGATETRDGTFTIGTATGPNGVPLGQRDAAEDAVNTILEPFGLRLEFPEVQVVTEPSDFVRVTPLLVILEDSQVGAAVLGPGLELTRAQREQAFDQLVGLDCRLASPLLVGDITLSIAGGSGFLAMEIGGVEASTDGTVFDNPFGQVGAPRPRAIQPGTPAIPGTPAVPGQAGTVTEPAAGSGEVAAGEQVPIGTLEEFCESVHPFGWPDCSDGAAPLVAVLGLIALGGMAVLDWQAQRTPAVAEADA